MSNPFHCVLALHALGLLEPDDAAAVDLALRFDAASCRTYREYRELVGDLAVAGAPVAPSPRVFARLAGNLSA